MKKIAKLLTIVFVIAAICALSFGLVACNDNEYSERYDGQVIRFAAPEGTPALAMLRLVTDNPKLDGTDMEYAVVKPALIQAEMRNKSADVVIMPINAGANLIYQGADYKLVSVAVEGSLYLIGNKSGSNAITMADIKGKKVACIGQNNVPGLTFEYVLKQNGIEIIYSGEPSANQVLIDYATDGPDARTKFNNHAVQYMVVGEPAATQFKTALSLNAEMDIQAQYKLVAPVRDADSYPQAGLFVRAALAKDKRFMNALFDALDKSEDWVENNPAQVSEFVSAHLYQAAFPAASIPRCAIDCDRLDNDDKNEIIAFLKIIARTDSEGNVIDWDGARSKLF
ncbi:MAG: hypothetical protein NC037_00045 [Bacteroides sp.]|nr:hypothetical protein [Bacillota bacterium]MCM1393356.1 hypothetical protein [[Eubacterium] siraeum]MCM1454910.1 hypothetical protein [Bacteroides sp.]